MIKLNKRLFYKKGRIMKNKNFFRKWQFWTNVIGIICILGVILFINQNNHSKKQSSAGVRSSHVEKKHSTKINKPKKKVKIQKKEENSEPTPEQEAEKIDKAFVATDYDSTIPYDSLARTPKENMSKKVTYNGEVVQVMEDDKLTELRVAIDENHDNIMYCIVPTSILHDTHILEDDNVKIYGITSGLKSYESTMGGKITIPSLIVTHIDDNGKSY